MSEAHPRGWHPDPFGIHFQRFYYEDDKPGRLVRDESLHETFDDPPGGFPDVVVPVRPARPWPPQVAANVDPGAAAAFGTSDPRAAAAAAAFARVTPEAPPPSWDPGHDAPEGWVDGPPDRWARLRHLRGIPDLNGLRSLGDRFRIPSRRVLAVAGACALAVVLLFVGIVIGTGGPGSHNPANSASGQQPVGTVPTLPAATAAQPAPGASPVGWQITHYFGASAGLNGVTCMTAAICEAVGDTRGASGLVLGTTNGGTNWTQQPVPKDTEGLEAISCPSHLACIAVGRNVITDTTNGGLTWATRVVSHVSFTGISCGGPKTCVAVGSPATNNSFCPDGVSYTTTDLGKSWSSTKLGCFQPAGISCPLASTCIAIGQQTANGAQFGQIMGTTDAGSNWQVQYKLVGGVTTLGGVACASATMCEVVGGSQKTPVLGTTNGGRSWIAQPTPALEVELTGVDCPSAQSCQAVGGGQSLTTANGGQTWGTQATPSAVAVFNSVACPLTTSCFGVGVSQVQAGLTLNLTS